MDMHATESSPSLPTPPAEWLTLTCGKCGRRVQVEQTPTDRYTLHAIPYLDDEDRYDHFEGLACPWCTMERGGRYPLYRADPRPALGWALYVDDIHTLYGHVPGEGWFRFPRVADGWAQRTPATDAQVRWTRTDPDARAVDFDYDPELGETGWPPFVEEWRAYLEDEALYEQELAEGNAALRAIEPAWTGWEDGWDLRPGLVEDGEVRTFIAWTPAGQGWKFDNVPGGWEARESHRMDPEAAKAPVDVQVAHGTGFPPAEARGPAW